MVCLTTVLVAAEAAADVGAFRCRGAWADVEGSMDVGHLVAAMAADASQRRYSGAGHGSVGAAPMIVDYHK